MSRFFGPFIAGRPALALLFLRVVFGLALIIHGFPKIQHPFNWMGPQAPVPGFLQFLAALSEFGGGIALVLGLLTSLASLGIFCTMLFAILMVHLRAGQPFVDPAGGPSFELPSHYLIIALALIIGGPGNLSLDSRIFAKS
jgi:putative oxidoreductase